MTQHTTAPNGRKATHSSPDNDLDQRVLTPQRVHVRYYRKTGTVSLQIVMPDGKHLSVRVTDDRARAVLTEYVTA